MNVFVLIASIVTSYLIGSISFARLVSKILNPEMDVEQVDLTSETDGKVYRMRSIGATAASINFGPKVGCAIGLLDILKVFVPTLIFRVLFPDQPYYLASAFFGMAGHNWPVYYRFNGGSGISAIYGGLMAIDPIGGILCAFAGLFLGLVVVRDLFIAYLSGIWLLIPWLWFRTYDPWHLLYAVGVNILFMTTLIPELRAEIKAYREGKVDVSEQMKLIPMGRMMLKMMEKIHPK